MNKIILILLVVVIIIALIFGLNFILRKEDRNMNTGYTSISQEEAKKYMDNNNDIVILDVRTTQEFSTGHIPNAINIPDFEIPQKAEKELPDKNQTILVYCRSGNRSKNASQILADMGYSNILEFGGINTWKYDIQY